MKLILEEQFLNEADGMSCQGTFAYVLPTFSSRWENAPWAFDPVHFNDPVILLYGRSRMRNTEYLTR